MIVADDFSALRGLYSSKTKAPGAGAAAARLPLAVSRARPKARKKLKGTMPSGGSTVRAVGSAIVRAPEGLKTIATEGVPAAYNYLRTSTPGEVWSDVKGGASALAEQARRDPGGTLADVLPFVGDAKAVGEMLREAALMRDAGDTEGANRLESLILPIATAGFIPEVGALAVKGARAATRGAGAAMRGADAPLAARPRYIRGQEGPFTTLEREGLQRQPIPEALETRSLAALRDLAQDRTRSPAIQAADEAAMAARGVPYAERAAMPASSLQRQAGMGRAYQAAVEGSPEYKSALFERYGEMMPEVVEQAKAQNLDQLTEAAYRQLGEEVTNQFDLLPLQMRYHQGEGEYGSSTDMIQDALGRGRLNVFSGGEPHEFLNQIDPATGLSQNEMFRAVHDYMGHVVPGSRFGPSGEEIAYAAHSQQLSPLAQMALLSETRGQNSLVNYSPLNADIIRESNVLRRQSRERGIAEKFLAEGDPNARKWLDQLPSQEEITSGLRDLGQQTQYAPQRAVLLPPEFMDAMSPGGTPEWLRPLLQPTDTSNAVRGVQVSRVPDLQVADPRFYGTGHKGQDYRRVMGDPTIPLRTHFYAGPEGTVIPEDVVMGMRGTQMAEGPRYAYEADLNNLYDINKDPSQLVKLAQAYNLPDYQPVLPLQARLQSREVGLEGRSAISDMERLVRDYGYAGYLSDFGGLSAPNRRAAAVFEPVSGLRPIERGLRGYAEGGYASGNSA